MKKCSHCKQIKPIDLFYNDKNYPDGKSNYCKVCKNASQKKMACLECGKLITAYSKHNRCKNCVITVRKKVSRSKRRLITRDKITLVPLGNDAKDGYAIIDAEDAKHVSKRNWNLGNNGYAYCRIHIPIKNGKRAYKNWLLHRYILGIETKVIIDHKDTNPLNCRKSNLRLATNSENLANRGKPKNNTSGYKGVYKSHNRLNPYRAQITVKGRSVKLGYFDTLEAAYAAYISAANKYFGEFARG